MEQISKSKLQRTIVHSNLSDCVKYLPRSGHPITATTEEKQLDAARSINEYCPSTVRKLHQQENFFLLI